MGVRHGRAPRRRTVSPCRVHPHEPDAPESVCPKVKISQYLRKSKRQMREKRSNAEVLVQIRYSDAVGSISCGDAFYDVSFLIR